MNYIRKCTGVNFIIINVFVLISLALHLNQQQTVVIIGTNDIHGSALPTQFTRSDNNQTYKYGGIQYMAHMIKTVKEQYKGNALYFDAGDQFQGGLESSPNISSGKIINQYMNQLKVDASAIGNHQFDFGPTFLLKYLKKRVNTSVNLAANLKNQKNQSNFLPLQHGSKIFTLNNGIKIGVIGLITRDTLTSTQGFINHLFPNYQFLQYAPVVISQSKKLKSEGADAVVLLCHLGNACAVGPTYGIWTQNTTQTQFCNQKGQLGTLINAIPNGTLDAVVQGHMHVFAHHFMNGVPYMGTINGGFYFNIMYLTFKNKKLVKKVIEGPIPVCQRIFNSTKRCNYHNADELKTAGPLVNWKFHGKLVNFDKKLDQQYQKQWIPLMKPYQQFVCLNQVLLYRNALAEHELGNLLASIMRQSFSGIDFSILNVGSERCTWYPGSIEVVHIYNMFPFNNTTYTSFDINGTILMKLLHILQEGTAGYYPFQGLKMTVKQLKNGTKEVLKVTLQNGTQIQPSKIYRGISSNTALLGLDDFATFLKAGYTFDNKKQEGEVKATVKTYLQNLKVIKPGYFYNSSKPRMDIVKE